uniref:Ubiquitin carboxyl-terminal hydrolase n=1 Tax=Cyclopterus lumpus TaxID=8103 RepID=A0A8C2Z5I3_CYCLU
MDRCKHVGRLRLGHDHSILNPQKWHCVDCSTTDSVWACLKCSHVACGRFMEEHSLKHFQESQHPLAMEVRELDRGPLYGSQWTTARHAVGFASQEESTSRDDASDRGSVNIKSCRISVKRNLRKLEDKKKEVKRRLMEELGNVPPRKSARLLTQAPRSTITLIPRKFRDPPERLPPPPKKPSLLTLSRKTPQNGRAAKLRRYYSTHAVTRRRLAPGVTGLRNLGNTCYMNSILQVLSHLQKFRECFLTLDLCETEELLAKTNNSQEMKGVTGGASELVQPKEPRCSTRQQMSLCHELHTLFRVMWSGRWSLVSPFAMLHSVWNLIPAFRGYDQQDAQEFLCELLDKVQQELDTEGSKRRIVIPITQRKLSKQVLKVLNTIFHGQLLSQVTCLSCKHKSNTVEPFWDLSLEFPERYHSIDKGSGSTAYQRSCTLTEMLSKFTEMEALEGSIYACNHCNKRRRKSSHKPLVLSEAHKQLLIYRLPQVLRLHLKRFRWSGRNHREKIGVHVAFDQVLNIKPYCCTGSGHSVHRGGYTYDLSAVVMHHGKGFGSGHYTAYCYNTEGGEEETGLDSYQTMNVEEVCNTQAYILFYTQRSA